MKIIHSGSGTITESDVMLAVASKGIIIGFNTGPEAGAERLAASEKVEIRHYNIIYNIIEDVEKALKGMLEPTFTRGRRRPRRGAPDLQRQPHEPIAGATCATARSRAPTRRACCATAQVIAEGKSATLKRFQDDVREVQTSFECGIQIDGFDGFEEGDVIEFFRIERDT